MHAPDLKGAARDGTPLPWLERQRYRTLHFSPNLFHMEWFGTHLSN